MSNPNHVFVGLPALIKNAAASDPIISAGDNHISGIGFFDAITGGTVNRDALGVNFRNTNFLAVVGTQVYFYTAAGVTDPDWTNGANWTELTNSDLTQALLDIQTNAGNIAINAGAISTNASGVSTNASDIANNAGDISTNAGAISTNAGSISTVQSDLAQEVIDRQNGDSSLLSQIQSNDTDIGNNSASITINASAISANSAAISGIVSADGSINTHDDVDTVSTTPEAGQVLFWDGTNWVPEYPEVTVEVKNDTGASLAKGTPVYVSGTHNSGKPLVKLADNDGSGTYPSIGLTYDTMAAGDEGLVVISGSIFGLNTIGYAAGDALYLDSTPGALTNTRPSGHTKAVQKVALVKRSHASAGSVIVMGAGRANDVPNLQSGYFWKGDGTGVAQPVDFDTNVAGTPAVSTNTTKLSGIEAGATADQTGAEIKAAYEVEANAFTDAQFTKLSGIATGATANSTDATLLDRANHTGTQTAATISDFDTEVSNNASVTANTAKVSADGLVTTHSDVTSAGSGEIITDTERTKLNGIASGAEVNVNADWNATSGDAEILNKPALFDGDYGNLTNVPATFTPAAHVHSTSDITGFSAAVTARIQLADLQDLNNVTATPGNNEFLQWNGATWVTAAPPASGVPYTGATQAVDLNSQNLTGVNSITSSAALFGASPQNLRAFNIHGTGLNGRLSIQSSSGGAPGIELTTDGNASRMLMRMIEVGTDGTSLEFWTEPDGGSIQRRNTLYDDGTLYFHDNGSATLDAGLRNSSGTMQFKDSSGSWSNIAQSGGSGSSNKRTLTVPAGNDYSGDVVTFGSAPSGGFTVGELYYYANTGAWEEAYGTSTNTSTGMLGICVNTSTPEILVRGIIRSSSYANQYTLGRRLYVSTLQSGSGRLMDAIPGSPPSGAVIRAVGYVINGINGVIMFDPSQDYITVT